MQRLASWRNRLLLLLSRLLWHRRRHTSRLNDVTIQRTRLNDQLGQWAAEPTAPMPAMLLIVTSPDIIADFLVCSLRIPT
jgi:hypothetical protein